MDTFPKSRNRIQRRTSLPQSKLFIFYYLPLTWKLWENAEDPEARKMRDREKKILCHRNGVNLVTLSYHWKGYLCLRKYLIFLEDLRWDCFLWYFKRFLIYFQIQKWLEEIVWRKFPRLKNFMIRRVEMFLSLKVELNRRPKRYLPWWESITSTWSILWMIGIKSRDHF